MIELWALDNQGNAQPVINGVPVQGALVGYTGLTFTPAGACIDKVPEHSVKVPLSDWRNNVVAIGTTLMIWDTDIQGEVGRGIVLDMTQTVDDLGVQWAQVSFPDVLRDLARASVTTGFLSSPGEAMTLTLVRLVGLADTAWSVINDVTGFDGITFSAYQQSAAQATGKLCTERFCHFRREGGYASPRVLHVSNFGTPFTAGGVPFWLTGPQANPTAAEEAYAQRQMSDVQFARKGAVTNSLTVTGGGNGPSQLTLRTLYGNTTFQGFNPAHPIQRRPRQDGGAGQPGASGGFTGGSFDGFDYYIADADSVALYGACWDDLNKQDINPVVSPAGTVSAADEQTAAISLYIIGDAALKRSALPQMTLTFTTVGRGDLRNIGGQTVHVTYDDYAFDTQNKTYAALAIDADYTVLEVARAVADDGTAKDTWTVSNNGQYAVTDGSALSALNDKVVALGASITTFPHRYTIPKSGSVDSGTPLSLRIRPDNSIVRHHYALLTIAFEGIRHTVTDNGHTQDVVTAPMNHDLAAGNTHDVGNAGGTIGFNFNIDGGEDSGTIVYDPNPSFDVFPNNQAPASAKPLLWDGRFVYASQGVASGSAIVVAHTLEIEKVTPTTGGTGGKVVKTTGAADIAAGNPNPGTVGGTVPKATHAATDPATGKPTGLGAVLTKATVERMSIGPLPTGVSVVIDGATRFTGVANGATLDLLPYVGDQAGHTVEIHAATIGGVDCQLDVSVDITTTALTPTGQ